MSCGTVAVTNPFSPGRSVLYSHRERYAAYFRGRKRVLDIGCGTGEFLQALQRLGIDAVGLDTTPESVRTARAAGLYAVQAEALPYLAGLEAGSFDGIALLHVVEHMAPDVFSRVLGEIRRILSTDGLILLMTPNTDDLLGMACGFWKDPTHVRPYPADLLVWLLEKGGFDVIRQGEDPETWVSRLRWSRRIGKRLQLALLRILIGPYFARGDVFVVGKKRE